ncbi:unnamed protein product [Heterobilharzia americana]|nr:unnamed protein product [Heterobilharzia americana]
MVSHTIVILNFLIQMDFFSRTPVKNDVLSIIGQLSSRKKKPRTPFCSNHTIANLREVRSVPLQFDDSTPEKLCSANFQKENSSSVKNVQSGTVDAELSFNRYSHVKTPLQNLSAIRCYSNASSKLSVGSGNEFDDTFTVSQKFSKTDICEPTVNDDHDAKLPVQFLSVIKCNRDTSSEPYVNSNSNVESIFAMSPKLSKTGINETAVSDDHDAKLSVEFPSVVESNRDTSSEPYVNSNSNVESIFAVSPKLSKTGINETAVSDDHDAKLSVEFPSVVESNRDASSKLYVSSEDNVDGMFGEFLVSSKAIMNKSTSHNYSNVRPAQASLDFDRGSGSNIRSNSNNSDDDDEAFEKFLQSQKTVANNSSDGQSSTWISEDSDEDGQSGFDSPYQTFYYRINNQEVYQDIKKPLSALFDSDFESDSENCISNERSQIPTVPLAECPSLSNRQKSRSKIEKCNRPEISTEEFVYSLYPIDINRSTHTTYEKHRHPDALKFVQKFKPNRCELAEKLYQIYNEKIFCNQLPSKLEITWSRRLLKTAGLCKYMTRTTTHSNGISSQIRLAQILLSEKVCTTAERVRDTLLHEICHAAVWLIDGINDGHGRRWKAWANRAHKIWPKLPMISVCHAYTIDTRFTYRCTGCGACINRHSKSLDISKKVCSYCRSQFELLIIHLEVVCFDQV